MSAPGPVVVVSRDAELLAASTAARLLTALVDAQADRGTADVVLTGGTIGVAVLEHVARSPALHAVDWSRVDVWWGDERFVEAGSEERNELQARRALLDHVDVDPARVHAIEPLGGRDGEDVDAAAERYAAELAAASPHGFPVPPFDVLLLGMGPEGHVASIFPESPAAHDERVAVAVRGCPKPPPTRVTLGFAALTQSRQAWLVVTGEQKAPAVAMALGGAGRMQVPAAGVRGRVQTLWLLDEPAASALPKGLRRL